MLDKPDEKHDDEFDDDDDFYMMIEKPDNVEQIDVELNDNLVQKLFPANVKNMELIKTYAELHEFQKKDTEIKHPLTSSDPNVYIPDVKDRNFIGKLNLDEKCELLMAANYFNIPALFELCCASIAAYFKGKDFEQIKGDLGLQDVTYTAEDEENLKKEYPWIMEQAEKKIAEIQTKIEQQQ